MFLIVILFIYFLLFPSQSGARVGGRVPLPLAGGGAARCQLATAGCGQSGGGELPEGVEDRGSGKPISFTLLTPGPIDLYL